VRRNVFRDSPPWEEAVTAVAARLRAVHQGLRDGGLEQLLAGTLPTP
jgi:hypothetical protein